MYSDVATERNPRGITGADTINPEYTGYDKDDYDFAEENRPADLGAPTPGGEETPLQQGPMMVEQPDARFDSDRPQGTGFFGIPAITPPYAPQPDENNS